MSGAFTGGDHEAWDDPTLPRDYYSRARDLGLEHLPVFAGTLETDQSIDIPEYKAEITMEIEISHAADVMFVQRNVKPSWRNPWTRLRGWRVTAYMEGKEPWTDDVLYEKYQIALEAGLDPEVWVRTPIFGSARDSKAEGAGPSTAVGGRDRPPQSSDASATVEGDDLS